jgi:hypothetical protein
VAERAQLLLSATLHGALATGTLVDTPRLTTFLSRAAGALTVDEQTTLGDLRGLAGALGNLSGDALERTGLPVAQVGYVPAGSDQSYVLLDSAATRSLFDAVIDRTRLPDGVTDGAAAEPAAQPQTGAEEPAEGGDGAAAPAADTGAQPLTAAPGTITVDVLNGTGTTGLASQVADLVRGQGFGVGTVGNAPGTVDQTVVRYGPAMAEQARTVAAAVPGSVLQSSDALGDAVQLVIGPGYSAVVPVTVGAPVAADTQPAGTQVIAAADTTTAADTTVPAPTAPACS